MKERYCFGCGMKFNAIRSDQIFHSKSCRLQYYKRLRKSEEKVIKVPISIKNKLESYYKHTQKAEQLRCEIEDWVKEKGVDTDFDSDDLRGSVITDVIIDTGNDGNIDEAIALIERELNS